MSIRTGFSGFVVQVVLAVLIGWMAALAALEVFGGGMEVAFVTFGAVWIAGRIYRRDVPAMFIPWSNGQAERHDRH